MNPKNLKHLDASNGGLLISTINENRDQINHLTIMNRLNYLVNMGELTKEELQNIHQMLISPDKENHVVALEIIKVKCDKIEYSKLYLL